MHNPRRIAICSLLLLFNADLATAQPKFTVIHGASAAKYDEWIDGLDKQKLRPAFVSVADIKGEPTYAAIAAPNKLGQAWAVKRDADAQEYQKEFLAQNAKGLRPVCVVNYRRGDTVNYAAIFLKDDKNKAWTARHGMNAKLNQAMFDNLSRAGLRPVQGTVCPAGDDMDFAYLFAKDGVKNWLSQAGLTADQYAKLIDDSAKKNMHPLSVHPYATRNGTRFLAIVAEEKGNRAWSTKHHLTSKQYQEYLDEMTGKGYQPTQICAYPWEDEVRYVAVFVKDE
jgi:hypothetical protein